MYVPFNATNKKDGDFMSSSTDGIRAGFTNLDACSTSRWCVKLDHDNSTRAFRRGGNSSVVYYGDATSRGSRFGNKKYEFDCFSNTSNVQYGSVPRLRNESYLTEAVDFPDKLITSSESYNTTPYKSVFFNGVQVACSFKHQSATSETNRYNIEAIPLGTRGFDESDSNIDISDWLNMQFKNEAEIMQEVSLVSDNKESQIPALNSISANSEHLKMLKQALTTTGSHDAEDTVLMTVYHSQDEAFNISNFKGTVKSSLPEKPTPFDYSSFDITNMTT